MDNNTNNWKEFTLGNPQEEPPKRIQPKKRSKKRILWLVLAAAALICIVAVALLWDQSSFDGLRRSIIYATAEKDESGCAELYQYAGDQTGRFAALDGSLVNLSANQLLLINEKGENLVNESIRFAAPTLVGNENCAVAYDTGGTQLYVLGSKGILWSLEGENGILAVTINKNNYVTVVSSKSGYRAAVCVYSDAGEPVFEYDSADRYVMMAALSADNRTLAAITMGQDNGRFVSYLMLYRTNSKEPLKKLMISNGVVYDIGWVDGCFCIVAEDGLYFIETDGTTVGSYLFGNVYLRRCCFSENDYASILVSRYKTGSQCLSISVDAEGNELGCSEIDGEVLSFDSAGRYTAVLCADHLAIYDKEMQMVSQLPDISEAHQVLMRADGSAVLAGSTVARLYLP